MVPPPRKHFLLVIGPGLGHVRPELSIIYKILQTDPSLIFTILAVRFLVPIVNSELQQASLPEAVASRIRTIGIGQKSSPPKGASVADLNSQFMELGAALSTAYHALYQGKDIACTATGRIARDFGLPPSVAFLDQYAPDIARLIKECTPHVVVINFWTAAASQFLSYLGPTQLGGLYDWEHRTRAAIEAGDGRAFEEVAHGILAQQRGELVPNADDVEMYDYEMTPQGLFPVRIMLPVAVVLSSIRQATQFADASMLPTTRNFQPRSARALEEWYEGKLGKKVFFVGPQVPIQPSQYRPPSYLLDPTNAFAPVFTFLDAQPANSVLLVSFGSVFYPADAPWRVEAVIKTLLQTRTPFIFSRAARMCVPFSSDLEDSIIKSGTGMVMDFVPQRDILGHPSMGAFLTHGGFNSMIESILAGVLNIFWPVTADQPMNSAYLSQNLDAAFELVQIRSGAGAGPPARGGMVEGTPDAISRELGDILTGLKGEVGERKLRNLRAVRRKLLDEMSEGGDVETDFGDLLRFVSAYAAVDGFEGDD
ncbi:hypothetical protein FRB97_004599 [Tulasnella sp. 331]|nr:hypothetical protein FRB97_004599 [Tulasnella sp. 331]KAG8883636.1 hypothetical protein FRB98_002886 [Tulasnella sp. 332]